MTRILVVDDEQQLLRALRINLTARRYDVLTAPDGATALQAAAKRVPDLVVLDLGLPDMDGTEVIAGLRGWTKVPILVLSGRTDAGDKVAALDAGADDYVTKPFNMDELLARIRALNRRAEPDSPSTPAAVIGHHTIDLTARIITRTGRQPEDSAHAVHLTKTEWAVLELLLRNPGRLVPTRQILLEVWGPEHESQTNYLRFYLARLRQKLEPEPSRPRHLLTEPGMGYRYQP
jgi:two-component system KDP operon response regulator KdpE